MYNLEMKHSVYPASFVALDMYTLEKKHLVYLASFVALDTYNLEMKHLFYLQNTPPFYRRACNFWMKILEKKKRITWTKSKE